LIRFLAYLLPFLAMRLLTFPLAPIAVALSRDYQLRWPFRWMMTLDFDLTGDGGHRARWPDYTSYVAQVVWMWRNGGHALSYAHPFGFGMPRGKDFGFWKVDATPGWQWRFGWNPEDFKQDRSKYNFTVRYRRAT
jgi:hypothetical protein